MYIIHVHTARIEQKQMVGIAFFTGLSQNEIMYNNSLHWTGHYRGQNEYKKRSKIKKLQEMG